MDFNYMVTGFLFVYFISLLITGIFAYRSMTNLEEFVLAGRRLKSMPLALTVSSTGMSGWLALGFAGYTYEAGFQSLWILVPSATIGIIICYALIAKKVRRYSERIGALTATELLRKRFYDTGNTLNLAVSLTICIASVAYISGQLLATGKILNLVFGWNFQLAIVAAAVIMITYSVMGGFYAVCWTDFIQGILMIVGSLVTGGLAIVYAGGLGQLSEKAAVVSHSYPDFVITPFASFSVVVMGVSMFIGDGIFNWIGQPTLMSRYMAAQNTRVFGKAAILTITIQLVLFIGVFLAAVYMRTQFPDPALLPYSGDTETVLIQFFFTTSHPVFVGIFIGAIMASIMSTADSLLIMATSVVVNDIYSYYRPRATQQHLVLVSRILILWLGLIAILISLNSGSVLWSSWFGWTALGIVGMPLIIGLYWDKASKEGAIAGITSGFAVLVIWNLWSLTERWNVFQALPACGIALLATWLVSLITSNPPPHVMKDVQELKEHKKFSKEVEVHS
ncbi:sodium/proline symporter [Tindallia californiensis]|uniref:Sodium/proline symporter n=1 Tax=Tindallia californiensis TaxID=159292 RepID=A0A1H3PHL6_9FIRM|nr:sodium/proline symporter [Tindallia californiensis]SDZ00551.1 sodium/proline symporter [Tindallia californiensis]